MTSISKYPLTLSLLGAAAALLAACGSDIATGGAGGGGTGSSGSTGVGGANGSCTVDSICPGDGTCIFPQGACSPTDKGT